MHAWICYIIYAIVDGRVRVYVGKTNDMHRRLRQHRGEIAGGAKETSRLRERGGFWQLAATNWGFVNEREALVFEAQLQDPRKRRLLRDKQEELRYMKELPRTLFNAHLLCDTVEFNHVQVCVHDTSPHPELQYPIVKFTTSPVITHVEKTVIISPVKKKKPAKKQNSIDARIEKYRLLCEQYISQL